MAMKRKLRGLLTVLLLFGMPGLVVAKSCEELGKKGPNWVTIDGTWGFVQRIVHIPPFPELDNNVIRLRPYTTEYGIEGWHVAMLTVTPTSDFIPPAPGVLIEDGFATVVGVLGKVTQNGAPSIAPEDIIAVGAFLAPFQRETVEFDGSGGPPAINGKIHYNGTLGFEGIRGRLTFTLDPAFFPDASGPWVGCFHLPGTLIGHGK